MHPTGIRALTAAATALLTLACAGGETEAGEGQAQSKPQADILTVECSNGEPPPALGLMTSLPIYWQLGQGIEDFARGDGELTWQRSAIEQCYTLVPLDTLSPIAGLGPNDPETDPIQGIDQIAVIQPRGLAPADNVALDEWVRGGGHLLLVLDPMLTGEYDLALGDPRRPVDSALIPPVVKRWGLEIAFDDEQELKLSEAALDPGHVWLSMAGTIKRDDAAGKQCELFVNNTIARCNVGKGQVTLVADAASFEHAPDEVENSQAQKPPLMTLLDFALQPQRNMVNTTP